MSVRLRLTLIYSAILALTLIIFSIVLYVGQERAIQNDFVRRLETHAQALSTVQPPPPPAAPPRPEGDRLRPLRPVANGRGGPGDYIQVRSLEGVILEHDPRLDISEEVPLSEEGLQALQQSGGQHSRWVEVDEIAGERFLIYSQRSQQRNGQVSIIQVAGELAPQEQSLQTLRTVLIIGCSATVVAAFGIGWLMAGLALRPINRITQTTRAIGTARDFSRRVEYDGPGDEIGRLTSTLNGMLAELQAAYLQVEQSLEGQRRFVADASHELRTPLTTVRGNLALLQREPPIGAEDRADVLADMVAETERLMRLVNDLLTLARIDARRPLRSEPVPIRPLLEAVQNQVQTLKPAQTITCQATLDDTVQVVGDRDALKQIFLVLLDNAVKHTWPETAITTHAALLEDRVLVTVADNGPGIPPSRLSHIFDRFYRGDAARTGSGAGLGLAIARELTEAQKGTISVESQPGQGCVFTVVLPRML